MRKRLPVIIMVFIHLLLVIGLAILNPVEDYIIKKNGTLHTFKVEECWLYGDFTDFAGFNCLIDRATDYENGTYATLATDENGISYISEIGFTHQGNDYIKTDMNTDYSPEFYFCSLHYKTDAEYYRKGVNLSPPLIDDNKMALTDSYDVTVKAWVYKGKVRTEKLYVNGVPLEEFLDYRQ